MDLLSDNPAWLALIVKLFEKLYDWLLVQVGKSNIDFSLPITNRKLAKLLRDRYDRTQFHLVRNQRAFSRTIGEVLISSIKKKRPIAKEGPADPHIRIGIVCGPMVYRAALEMERSRVLNRDDFKDVSFVAMNKAAEHDAFQYSANYLVAFLARLFPHSHSVAYTFNKYDTGTIADERRSPDILLCSAGTYPNAPKSYLQLWCEKTLPHFSAVVSLGPNCVGDFCLIPIDSSGRTIGDEDLLNAIYDGLDPRPRFKTLFDHSLEGCRIIFPINIERDAGPMTRWSSLKAIPTGKEAITRTILRSGVASDCVLERDLARNLVFAVGDYLIESASEHEVDRPLRFCKAYDFRRGGQLRDVYVSDPLGRLDCICRVTPGAGSRATSLKTIPQIIFSESRREFEKFSFESSTGIVSFRIDGEDFDILVQRHVRKPGQIPLLTLQMMAFQVEQMFRQCGKRVKVWDVGCGTGFLGLVGARLLGNQIEEVICSDLSPDAVACTRSNLVNLKVDNGRIHVEQADLFEASVPHDLQDLIVFNAPFLPDGLPGVDSVDAGGPTGIETALRFCGDVGKFIRPGGRAVLAVAEYVDDGRIWQELSRKFGREHVTCDERLILYPHDTEKPIPPASEISVREELEKKAGQRFETCLIGKLRFVAFVVRHYCAVKPS